MNDKQRTVRGMIVCVAAMFVCVSFIWQGVATSDDWPTHRYDAGRSARSSENLPAADLQLHWAYGSPFAPVPAWYGPAKHDAVRSKKGLGAMRNYDPTFFPIAAVGRVYFGSSADDAVHCLDAVTGEQRWLFTTDGPIRVAPTFHKGKLYFGSDDGYAYCTDAGTGRLIWRTSPRPGSNKVLNDGRLISFWPCRTGVLVYEDTAYFGASLFPWRKSFLCAVDAKTGRPEGAGRYIRTFEKGSGSFEAAMAASKTHLILPQGRIAPACFDRVTGKRLPGINGAGTFVLLTPDNEAYAGPDSRDAMMPGSKLSDRTRIAHYRGVLALIVDKAVVYRLHPGSVAAESRPAKKGLWGAQVPGAVGMILAGETLFVGGEDVVVAISTASGKELWRAKVRGRAYGLAAANGGLFVSTDEGITYGFRVGKPKRVVDVPASTVEEGPIDTKGPAVTAQVRLKQEPTAQFDSPGTAVVRWETAKPSATILEYGIGSYTHRFADMTLKTAHAAKMMGLRRNRVYAFRVGTLVDGQAAVAAARTLETFFNYALPDVSGKADPFPVVAPARRSRLRVIAFDTDPARAAAARKALHKAGVYGQRVTVLHVDALSRLPVPKRFANLIVSERLMTHAELPGTVAEIHRILRPSGGVAYLGRPGGMARSVKAGDLKQWLADCPLAFEVKSDETGLWAKTVRGQLPGAGEWTHQYGRADNSAFGGETLEGAQAANELEAQWVGRPGPRYHTDRQPRKAAHLYAKGRLFAQGLDRMIAIDAYNGSVLWSLEMPNFKRFNIPHDSSNWCTDGDYVFAVSGRQCWQIDAVTGRVVRRIDVLGDLNDKLPYEWGYVGTSAGKLIGTANRQGGAQGRWQDALALRSRDYDQLNVHAGRRQGLFRRDARRAVPETRPPAARTLRATRRSCSWSLSTSRPARLCGRRSSRSRAATRCFISLTAATSWLS